MYIVCSAATLTSGNKWLFIRSWSKGDDIYRFIDWNGTVHKRVYTCNR